MNKVQNVQVSDTTADATKNNSSAPLTTGHKKIITKTIGREIKFHEHNKTI